MRASDGPEYADAVDIDPNAVDISLKNAELNGLSSDRFRAYAGDIPRRSLAKRFGTVIGLC